MSVYPLRDFRQNEVVFSEGSRADAAFILKSGKVEISIKAGDQDKQLATLTPPAVFGEMSLLLQGHKRTATVKAVEPSEVVEIGRQAFDEYIDKSPPVIGSLLKALAGRLQEATVKAMRSPVLFVGVCEVLHLLAANTGSDLLHDQTVQSLSKAFAVDAGQIAKVLEMMSDTSLIELKQEEGKGTVVHIPKKDDFLERAYKIHQGLKSIN